MILGLSGAGFGSRAIKLGVNSDKRFKIVSLSHLK
jgi:hypothetical protein